MYGRTTVRIQCKETVVVLLVIELDRVWHPKAVDRNMVTLRWSMCATHRGRIQHFLGGAEPKWEGTNLLFDQIYPTATGKRMNIGPRGESTDSVTLSLHNQNQDGVGGELS